MFPILLLFACLGGGFVPCLLAGDEPSSYEGSRESAERRAEHGVLPAPLSPLPSPLVPPSTGAAAVRVTRRERTFSDADLLAMLAAVLQQDYVKDKGELELRLTRPWNTRNVPDEVLSLKVLELPNAGVTTSFIVRFELRTAQESLGTWQTSVQAKVWREAWVAKSALKRGQLVADADLARERRDVLTVRDTLAGFADGSAMAGLEMAEPLQVGTPLLARSVKVRPVIRRGQFAEARVQDGALQVTLKVEALEDGAPGQTIRARNPLSRRDLTGKVLNEQTILVSL